MPKPRIIKDLKWASVADRNPFPGPSKLTGTKAQGLAFQNKVGRFLAGEIDAKRLEGKLYSDLWLMFEDCNGNGFAQPDHFLLQPNLVVVFECKLSQNSRAWPQIELLYQPLLAHLFKRPVIGVQAFKRMRYEEPKRPQVQMHRRPLEFEDGAIWHYFN